MKNLKVLFIGILCFVLSGCMQEPTINYASSDVKLNDLQSVATRFNFNMHNPNSMALNGKIDYTLFVEGKEFLTGQSTEISAPANQDTTFALEQNIEFSKIFGSTNELLQAVSAGQKTIKARVAGQYTTKVMGIFDFPIKIDQEIEIPLPEAPSTEDLMKELGNNLQNQLQDQLQNLFK